MATLPPPPPISSTERYVAGHTLHVYGLDELSTTAQHVTVLWLHHGRGSTSAGMADFALRCVGAYHGYARSSERGLLAIAFDQRNHGTRKLNPQANESWTTGNPAHAQDMFALIAGAVVDNRLLIDLLQASLFPEKPLGFIDSHYVLGVSLGGHSTWQLMFADERVTTGVSIIGCPDYMFLLSDRAKASKLSTYDTANDGAGFLGSKDFPPDLVRACRKYDPKGLIFGTQAVTWPLPPDREGQTKQKLASRLRGKKFLNCSGGADKLVPYRISEPFLGFLKNACEQWTVDLGVQFDDRIYPGVGHEFSPEMVKDAVKFIIDAVATEQGSGGSVEAAKI